jgi:opacity protein-like surface antigen
VKAFAREENLCYHQPGLEHRDKVGKMIIRKAVFGTGRHRRDARRLFAAALAAALLAALLPPAAHAQIFGQYTTAAIAPLGEGAAFVSAGDARLRIGVAPRFLITPRSDLGLQLGYIRTEEIDNYGFGADYKFYIVNEDPTTGIDLSADISLGWLGGSGYSRGIVTAAFMVSGMIDPEARIRFEPYGSVGFIGQYFFAKGSCGETRPGSWPCDRDDWSADSDLLLRGGTKIWLTDEYQVYVELDYDRVAVIGAAMNVVF